MIDCRVPDVCNPAGAASLLSLPVAGGSLLDHVVTKVTDLPGRAQKEVYVLPNFETGEDYESQIAASTKFEVKVLDHAGLAATAAEAEATDSFVLVDAARWPLQPVDLAEVLGEGDCRTVTHLIGIGRGEHRARERIERDGAGQVRRVRRLYESIAWTELASTGVFLSMVPGRALADFPFRSLAELRAGLAARGVISRDVPLEVELSDLSRADGILDLNERLLTQADASPRPGHAPAVGLRRGRNCDIADSARFIGPVTLQDNVRIGPHATIVGPTVIASGSEVGANAIVAQSVLLPNAVVEAGMTLRHCLTSGRCAACEAGRSGARPACHVAAALPERLHASTGGFAATDGTLQRHRRAHLAAKRVLDVTLSLVALILLSPVLAAAALAIKITSPGSVFFVHHREQRGGKQFPCIKFRTMVADAHRQQRELYQQNEVDGPQFKLGHDPRVTKLGAWLRRTNLDELPQLFNVFAGHMSLVGPRPSPFRENQICVPWRRARLSVRPGITGLWQICRSADRSAGDFHEWIFYDIAYVRHFSFWLDLKILLFTVLTGGWWSVPLSRLIPVDHDGGSPAEGALTTENTA